MTPGDLYRTCRFSAHRLETLQNYLVADDIERQRAFLDGQPLPPPRQSKIDDMRLVRKLRKAGRTVGRVHVVDRPLSDYVRYELAVYAENLEAGEDVRIADRSRHEALRDLDKDFAIFDGGTEHASAVFFDYSAEGVLLRYRYTTENQAVADCWNRYQETLRLSEPLESFLANRG
jgi:hypothetical protein